MCGRKEDMDMLNPTVLQNSGFPGEVDKFDARFQVCYSSSENAELLDI